MKQSHTKLLQLTVQKNQGAFKELYDQTSPKIFSVILHFLPKKYQAEEVLQDVYQEVWLRCGAYNAKKSSVIVWVLEITKNKIANKLGASRKCLQN